MTCTRCKKREALPGKKQCGHCTARKKEWREAHKEERREAHKEHAKAYYRAHKGQQRAWKLMSHYGITLTDFDALLAKQGGHCAVCPATKPSGRGTWHVDHVHVEGYNKLPREEKRKYVRGLLCHRHNIGIGCFNDSPEELREAITYLERL